MLSAAIIACLGQWSREVVTAMESPTSLSVSCALFSSLLSPAATTRARLFNEPSSF